ncbi:MAG: hypothetical protein M1840_006782 [Geoglossum simile]|nr:MAG: hypothetical protein M1840_006782 [Geoglossum simile]
MVKASVPDGSDDYISVDEIQEVLDKRSGEEEIEYLVVLKAAKGEGSRFWLSASEISGDIHSLIGLERGTSTSSSTPSAFSIKTDNNKGNKRKRSSQAKKKPSLNLNSGSNTSDTGKLADKKDFPHRSKPNEGSESSSLTTLDDAIMVGDIEEELAAARSYEAFQARLDEVPGPPITLYNDIDSTSPSLGFRFIEESIICDGVIKASKESMYGCTCRLENGSHTSCEDTTCSCLDQMAESQFPYKARALRDGHLDTRMAIFECNSLCNCDDNCKNKLVQWGRTVPLEIFKTSNRGWGLRCPVDLRKGDFIDVYKGEVITNDEANRREVEKKRVGTKENYLYVMEKFAEANDIPANKLYTVDGERFGGPTRFMNHSCDPNSRQFTVSYHHGDMFIYDLAFFALNFIPAHTELTFNYTDAEHTGPKRRKSKRATGCLCGSSNCRGYIWP